RIAPGREEGKEKGGKMTDRPPGRAVAETWAIALDGGTTNTRARLMKGGRVVATSRRAVGVRDTVLGAAPASSPPASASSVPGQPHRARRVQAVGEVVAEVGRDLAPSPGPGGAVGPVEFLIAAGMLSSEVGLLAVPHLPAPASLEDLTRAMAVTTIAE